MIKCSDMIGFNDIVFSALPVKAALDVILARYGTDGARHGEKIGEGQLGAFPMPGTSFLLIVQP